jgi:hypothetical protein
MKMEPTESSETSAFKTQTPGKYPKENILHKEHGESLKSGHPVGLSYPHLFVLLPNHPPYIRQAQPNV